MSVQDVTPELDRLEAQLDNLEACLEPLLEHVSGSASQLPLVDRAKLYTLTNYALESLLFSGLRLQGAEALTHPVFTTELKRVKQYFAKIEAAENPVEPRTNMSLNTEAAVRVIKAGLSDDQILKNKLAEQAAKERAKAFLKNIGKRRPDAAPGSSESSPAPPPSGDSGQSKRRKRNSEK
ncbi:related to small unique nuclear receptor co-repressor [Cephalotrichum gorgonifer]|uniref:Exosome complex protein n=1 Tax=Cephalotrichum gorgonifer TaxID=2041049 RepID=A0AAE8MTV7_9PEZI|nr:related to small unique nuclear receptor co-repressor [Cephalotrichum gorgonifer]